MGTLIYVVLIAVCIVLVNAVVDSFKRKSGFRFMNSRPLELLSTVLFGMVLAGVIVFFFRFLFIPIALLIIIYLFATKYRR